MLFMNITIKIIILFFVLFGTIVSYSQDLKVKDGYLEFKGVEYNPKFGTEEFVGVHKTLPVGTYLRVTNLESGKKEVADIKIIGKGAYNPQFVLFLSKSVERVLDPEGSGTILVELMVIPAPAVSNEPKKPDLPKNIKDNKLLADASQQNKLGKGKSKIDKNSKARYEVLSVEVLDKSNQNEKFIATDTVSKEEANRSRRNQEQMQLVESKTKSPGSTTTTTTEILENVTAENAAQLVDIAAVSANDNTIEEIEEVPSSVVVVDDEVVNMAVNENGGLVEKVDMVGNKVVSRFTTVDDNDSTDDMSVSRSSIAEKKDEGGTEFDFNPFTGKQNSGSNVGADNDEINNALEDVMTVFDRNSKDDLIENNDYKFVDDPYNSTQVDKPLDKHEFNFNTNTSDLTEMKKSNISFDNDIDIFGSSLKTNTNPFTLIKTNSPNPDIIQGAVLPSIDLSATSPVQTVDYRERTKKNEIVLGVPISTVSLDQDFDIFGTSISREDNIFSDVLKQNPLTGTLDENGETISELEASYDFGFDDIIEDIERADNQSSDSNLFDDEDVDDILTLEPVNTTRGFSVQVLTYDNEIDLRILGDQLDKISYSTFILTSIENGVYSAIVMVGEFENMMDAERVKNELNSILNVTSCTVINLDEINSKIVEIEAQ